MPASNMTTLKPEYDDWGIPTMKPYLAYLIQIGAVNHLKVKWGKGDRWAIQIGDKKCAYNWGNDINKNLRNKNVALHIRMP